MSTSQKLILLVEDDITSRTLTKEMLTFQNYQVIEAHSGDQVLRLLETHTPDLILTDVSLPGLDGLDLVRHVRAQSHLTHIPIVTISGYGRPVDRQAALDAGANSYLTKLIKICTNSSQSSKNY